jgi:uncharacterized membrane protein YraQ (UPF0718 family)
MAEKARLIDGTLLTMLGLVLVLVGVAWAKGGSPLVLAGLSDGSGMLLRFLPLLVVSFLAAGFAELLIPQDWVRERLGADSGFTGLLIGAGAGVITPAGPFVSMPIAAVMIRSGAAVGPVVAFLTGWSLLALHRFLAWEVPILGFRFAAFRYATCLLLPLIAGALARALSRS